MAVDTPIKIISARVPSRLHEATLRLAKRESKSVNELVAEVLAERVQRQEEQDLYDAFTLLGQDNEEADVEFALAAQAEVADAG
jgi:predicted nucleotidyltransferase component of viral defense system